MKNDSLNTQTENWCLDPSERVVWWCGLPVNSQIFIAIVEWMKSSAFVQLKVVKKLLDADGVRGVFEIFLHDTRVHLFFGSVEATKYAQNLDTNRFRDS